MNDSGADVQAVAKTLKGDQTAFKYLVDRYQGSLYRFLYYLLGGRREKAEELVQEAFLKVYEHLRRYDPNRKFSTWLFAIARNLAIDELKKSKPYVFSDLCNEEGKLNWLENRHSEQVTPLTLCVENEEQIRVLEAVRCLPPEYRDVVVLRYFEGLPYREISEILQIPVTTVKIRLFRAKKRLLIFLEQEDGHDEDSISSQAGTTTKKSRSKRSK